MALNKITRRIFGFGRFSGSFYHHKLTNYIHYFENVAGNFGILLFLNISNNFQNVTYVVIYYPFLF